MYHIYGDLISGNCYKLKLLLELTGQAYEWQHTDLLAGDTRTDEFLLMNANAKVPVLKIVDGDNPPQYLAESNAILNYLAEGTPYLPEDRYLRAQVLQWQFFEQYSHEPFIAVARYINKYLGLPEARIAEYHAKQEGGHKALSVMEEHLQGRNFFVGDADNDYATIADISLYAYTHVSHEGGFMLEGYPRIVEWLRRVEALPGFAPMV